jgi:hypothetical protein
MNLIITHHPAPVEQGIPASERLRVTRWAHNKKVAEKFASMMRRSKMKRVTVKKSAGVGWRVRATGTAQQVAYFASWEASRDKELRPYAYD